MPPTDLHDLDELATRWRLGIERERTIGERLRREIHRQPRLSGDEADTRDLVAERTGMTFAPIAETGGIVRVGPADGPSIMLRGELDALPVREATGVDWASAVTGRMHACGHDVHLAGLAIVLRAAARLPLPFGLVAVLQPREETNPPGAFDVVHSGALQLHQVEGVIGAHVHPLVPLGAIATGGGAVNAAADELDIVVRGQGGHGAYPYRAADVVAPLAQISLSINEAVRRAVDPMHPALVSVGTMTAGTGAANVLPGYGRIRATMRTTRPGDEDRIVESLRRTATGIAAAHGCTAEVIRAPGMPVLWNDPALAAATDNRLPQFGLASTEPMRSLGGDDFSFYGEVARSLMCFVGVDPGTPGASLHDPRFLPDEHAPDRLAGALVAGYLGAAELIAADHGA